MRWFGATSPEKPQRVEESALAGMMLLRRRQMRTLVLLGFMLALVATSTLRAPQYTRGVGVYPGDSKEDFAPVLVPDAQTYRNLALHRPAYHSSSYDYNLTAQLVTDGIKDTKLPRWISVSTSENGTIPKYEREHLVDQNPFTSVDVRAARVWVQIELGGGDTPLEVDRMTVSARAVTTEPLPQQWSCVVLSSDDGQKWTELGRASNTEILVSPVWWQPKEINPSFTLPATSRSRFYRVQLDAPKVTRWNVSEVALFDKNERVEVGGPYDFTSAWKSAGSGAEWVYVDLGAECTFDRVVLYWIRRAAEGSIQVSDDAKDWRTLRVLPAASGPTDDLKLAHPARGRYVRLLMTRAASPEGYILSELEVYGHGGPVPRPKPAPAAQAGGRQELAGGAWRVQRDSLVAADGRAISRPAFKDQDWLVATVPGTVLSSYWNAGALPDPNYGDNQLMISDSFFYADFWYRNEFATPPAAPGQHVWLNFNGINWKAEVFLNGELLGRIDGGFMRGRFDVTKLLRKGGRNALAVLVKKNDTPGSMKEKTFETPDKNGGALGKDNPTYHASVGWDWIPTIRGRDCGIWSDVFLTTSGPVTIENPFVSTILPLPDVSHADVSVEATLRNNDSKAVTGTLRGRFGDVSFEKQVTVDAASVTTVKFDPSTTPALRLQQPKLWWPAGYGDPNLYDVRLSFETARRTSDTKSFQAGVRQFTYSDEGGALKIWINGRRLIPRGGNWGFPESMLRYRAREYDIAARYHAEMNFTMIRNWVGQTGDDEFYEACDRHGIVIWQDFWLANPFDGPDPADNELFLRNASDFILRVRNHPSLGLYCGRNEGNPPKPLDDGLRSLLATLHPGLHYISNSAFGVVSGGGPYRVMPRKFYFAQRATPKLHSELGMPSIVTMDSLKQMMPEADLWPQRSVWGLHDFTANGAQGGGAFRDVIEKGYGGADNVADWVTLAQFVNYDGYRAMFEAQSKNRMGVLLWMSHPAWPSFVWQTYDYYFEPTAAYFGSKKASEPLHIQWNSVSDAVEVVNYSGGQAAGLTARAEVLNMDGSIQWEKTAAVDSAEDSVVAPIAIEYPSGLTPVHFIRLKLTRGGETVSDNFYWRGLEEGNYRAIRQLPKVKLEAATRVERRASRWVLTTELDNTSRQPALMVRVKAVREKSGDRILPAIYSDNYVALMPGERRVIRTEMENADTRGERPRMVIEGFNVGEVSEK
jgi:Exo-beta-D-glucosaminidase Ig-fold domain/Glycosyl hydrolases family 2/F5/8 type C domain/Glycosyl hydrolases family 2, sugar binding domain